MAPLNQMKTNAPIVQSVSSYVNVIYVILDPPWLYLCPMFAFSSLTDDLQLHDLLLFVDIGMTFVLLV